MTPPATAQELARLLELPHAPVAVTFIKDGGEGVKPESEPIPAQPAGCCFWEPGQRRTLDTRAEDHAHCSVGSYTHGLIPLGVAAGGEDTAALIGSGWVTEDDLGGAAHLPFEPDTIRYQPAAEADDPDVVLVRLTATALMTLQGAWPALSFVTKPQCQIVPLAEAGAVAVSPGCAVSRVRTGLPAGELTCALPARDLPAIVDKLASAVTADQAVGDFAEADRQQFEVLD